MPERGTSCPGCRKGSPQGQELAIPPAFFISRRPSLSPSPCPLRRGNRSVRDPEKGPARPGPGEASHGQRKAMDCGLSPSPKMLPIRFSPASPPRLRGNRISGAQGPGRGDPGSGTSPVGKENSLCRQVRSSPCRDHLRENSRQRPWGRQPLPDRTDPKPTPPQFKIHHGESGGIASPLLHAGRICFPWPLTGKRHTPLSFCTHPEREEKVSGRESSAQGEAFSPAVLTAFPLRHLQSPPCSAGPDLRRELPSLRMLPPEGLSSLQRGVPRRPSASRRPGAQGPHGETAPPTLSRRMGAAGKDPLPRGISPLFPVLTGGSPESPSPCPASSPGGQSSPSPGFIAGGGDLRAPAGSRAGRAPFPRQFPLRTGAPRGTSSRFPPPPRPPPAENSRPARHHPPPPVCPPGRPPGGAEKSFVIFTKGPEIPG